MAEGTEMYKYLPLHSFWLWICNYISVEQWGMITIPFGKSNGGFDKHLSPV